jgi:hypothetical protein
VKVSAPNRDPEAPPPETAVNERLTLHCNTVCLSETNEKKLFVGLKKKIKNREKYANLEILQLITLADTDKIGDLRKIQKSLQYLNKQEQIPEQHILDFESVLFNCYESQLSPEDGKKRREILMAKNFRETIIEENREEGREELLEQFRKFAKAKGLERELREFLDELDAETETEKGKAAPAKPSPGKAARGTPSRGKKP